MFILNNRELGKISETQHFDLDDRFANTTLSGGYTVPNFEKIAEAYGIRAATLSSAEELDNWIPWIEDDEPCLFDISLPEKSLLTPKIKFETQQIRPNIDSTTVENVLEVLRR